MTDCDANPREAEAYNNDDDDNNNNNNNNNNSNASWTTDYL